MRATFYLIDLMNLKFINDQKYTLGNFIKKKLLKQKPSFKITFVPFSMDIHLCKKIQPQIMPLNLYDQFI